MNNVESRDEGLIIPSEAEASSIERRSAAIDEEEAEAGSELNDDLQGLALSSDEDDVNGQYGVFSTGELTQSTRCYGKMDVREGSPDGFDPLSYLSSCSKRTGKQPHRLTGLGLRGLRNIGNTCFMNSILQCLSNTEPLLTLILSTASGEPKDLNRGSTMKGELFVAFANLIKNLWSKKNSSDPADPSALKDKIQTFCSTFRGARQHDSQELLRFLLEGIHSDLNRVKEKPSLPPLDFPPEATDEEKGELAWKWNLKYENSQISDIFMGQLKSTLTCLTCGNRSVTFDPFWDLSISLPSSPRGGPVHLTDILKFFTKEETLDGENKARCSRCQKHQNSTKRITIQKFPDVLVLHLKRFGQDGGVKLRTAVKFPLDNLDLGVYSEVPVPSCSYNLFAISDHFGTAYSGHYVAFAKHPFSKDWHQYDDSRVMPCEAEELSGADAYLLFYELSLASKCCMERSSINTI